MGRGWPRLKAIRFSWLGPELLVRCLAHRGPTGVFFCSGVSKLFGTQGSPSSDSLHIRNIYKKAAYRLNIMRMLKYDLDQKSLHRFYISFIRPTLEYGNILWDNCTDDQAKLLESIQLDAARIITGLRKGTNHDVLYKETGLSGLASRRRNAKLIQFYKILNNESPTYIDEIVRKFNAHNTGYNLRNSNLLKHPTPRTRSYKKNRRASSLQQQIYGMTLIKN